MRNITRNITFVFVASLAAGCMSKEGLPVTGPNAPGTPAAGREKVATETKEAALAMQDYAYAQKAEFIVQMKKELVGIEQELDRLAAKVDRSTGEAKVEARDRLDEVRAKWVRAKKQLEQADDATESTWDDVKGGFREFYGDLKVSFNATRQWLSDRIEP